MEIKGINFAEITLHVGLGNFRSVDVEDLTKHKMDSEQINIPEEAAEIINRAKQNHHRVCAVGTTVLRTLESSVTTSGQAENHLADGPTSSFSLPTKFSIPDHAHHQLPPATVNPHDDGLCILGL